MWAYGKAHSSRAGARRLTLSHDPQCPLAANKQLGEVRPDGRLLGAGAGLDDLAVGEDNSEAEDVIARDAVLDSVRARRVGPDNPANLQNKQGAV